MELTKETLLDIVGAAHSTMKKGYLPEENNHIQRLADVAYCLYCMVSLGEALEKGKEKVETKPFFDGCICPQVKVNGLSPSEMNEKKEPIWIDASKTLPTPQQTETVFRSRKVLIKGNHGIRKGTLMLSEGNDRLAQTFWTDDELFTMHGVTHWAELKGAEVPSVASALSLSIYHRLNPPYGVSREICKICYHVNRIGFHVPGAVWSRVVPPHLVDHVVCLDCFTSLADEKLIPWDSDISFYPVSLAAHLRSDNPSIVT